MSAIKIIDMKIVGLGMILYSPKSAEHIEDGENYFEHKYNNTEEIKRSCVEGTIVGFCTSSPGHFRLQFRDGYPTKDVIDENEFGLRLAVRIFDEVLCVRDLYDLKNWAKECPSSQKFPLKNGIYHVTLISNLPSSGILGQNQKIFVYLHKLDSMPTMKYVGVPTLCE